MAFIKGIILRGIERAGYSVIHVEALKGERRAAGQLRDELAKLQAKLQEPPKQGLSTHREDQLNIDYEKSPIEPMFAVNALDAWETRLRAELKADIENAADRELPEFRRSQTTGWFQRIAVPGTRLTTTSDHARNKFLDDDPLQSFGGRLSVKEASILRPYAKWCYIEPLLPDLRGKTVLEAGSNCGFFSFEFVKAGAAEVTGVEIVKESVESAKYMADAMGCNSRVRFINDDFTKSLEIKAHDIVFMSEVLTHSPCPVSTIYAAVLLAKETLIIDDFFERHDLPLDFFISTAEPSRNLGLANPMHPVKFAFVAALVSEYLLLTSLRIAGVLPEHVRRLRDPVVDRHSMIIVDTRGARERRQQELSHPYLRSMIGMERD